MPFEACESRFLMHFVPLPSFGMVGGACFNDLYLTDFQLFR